MSKLDLKSMPDQVLHLFSNNLFEKTTDKAIEWHISSANLLSISVPVGDWNLKYPFTLDPATRTPLAISAKKLARTALIKALRPFLKNCIYGNPFMDETAFLSCKCPIHSTNRTPYGPPATVPRGNAFPAKSGHNVILDVFNDDGAVSTRALPDGVAMVLVRYKIGGAQPETEEDCPKFVLSSTTNILIELKGTDAAQYLYLYICWIGNSGAQGQFTSGFIRQAIP